MGGDICNTCGNNMNWMATKITHEKLLDDKKK